jgi:glycosyltransferase involved in cell wall biosynthesis
MGWKGVARDLIRLATQTLLKNVIRPPYKKRNRLEVLAQNSSTARAIDRPRVRIVPNGTSVNVEEAFQTAPGSRSTDVITVSRLISWKGGWLAIRAMRHTKVATRLRIFGDGPDRDRLERLVRRWSLSDRVEFVGPIPRTELLGIVRHSGVMLHAALRDEAPLAVGEAMSLGAPVVLLQGSGAHEVATTWPDGFRAVKPTSAEKTARRLAAAIDDSLRDSPSVLSSPRQSELDFSKEILWAYERAADLS